MPAETFLDTNILLYGYDLDAGPKREAARKIIENAWLHHGSTAISIQVLQEFHVNFVRKGHSISDATAVLNDLSLLPVVENTLPLLRLGLSLQSRWQVSLWDAMILAAAQISGAKTLLSEDLSHQQNYGTVRVINPFI